MGKCEKLGLSHLLEYFAGIPYWKKRREGEREGEKN